MTEREGYIVLNRIAGVGIATVKRLVEALGSVPAIFEASEADFAAVKGVGTVRARLLAASLKSVGCADELARAEAAGVKLVTLADEGYPAALREIVDPPLVLYVRGAVEALSLPGVAIVGTRHPTIYGADMAEKFGYEIACSGYSVISGFAEGVDTRAHRGALRAEGGVTVAVIGAALDQIYPSSNIVMADEVVARGGALVSEYPFGRRADRQTFPMRNRIVSGLAKGLLVIEAPMGSGTLITVDQALDQGRPVMAVPGRIDVPQAAGALKVIREGGQLVRHVQDVLDELQLLPGFYAGRERSANAASSDRVSESVAVRPPQPPLSGEEAQIMACITVEGIHIDEIVSTTGLLARTVASRLVGLQLRKRVRLLEGGMVVPA